MKKKVTAILVSLVLMLANAAAFADTTQDLLKGFGLTEQDLQQFQTILAGLDENTSQQTVLALLGTMLNKDLPEGMTGTLEGDLYTHPLGFTMTVPEGWKLVEQPLGVSAMVITDPDENGFSDTISVLALTEERGDFETMTRETVEALFTQSLTNYQFQSFESFDYQDAPAHEFTLAHGEGTSPTLYQRLLMFNKDGKAFLITMTTRNDEEQRATAEAAYGAFMAGFTVFTGEGNG